MQRALCNNPDLFIFILNGGLHEFGCPSFAELLVV